jgi:polysaccharide biosynthesis transport protein
VLTAPSSIAPTGLSATPDAVGLLKALRRRWFLAGALGVLMAVVAATTAYLVLAPRFVAFAVLQVSSKDPAGFDRQENRIDFSTYMKTSAERLKSRDVAMKALSQDGVRNLRLIRKHPETMSVLAWIEESLKVDYREGSELLNISLTGDDPTELTALLNAMTKSYLQIISAQEKATRKERLKKYQELHELAKERLNEKAASKEALLRGQGAKDGLGLLQKQMMSMQRLQIAQEQLSQRQYTLDQKNAKMAVLQGNKKNLDSQPPPEIALKDLAELDLSLKQDVVDFMRLEKVIKGLRTAGHPPEDVLVRQHQAQLTKTKARMDKRIDELKTEVVAKLRKSHEAKIVSDITDMQTEIMPLEGQIRKDQEKVETLAQEANVSSFWTAKLNLLESEIQQQDKAVAQLFDEVQRARIADEAEMRIAPIGDAEWQVRDAKKRILMIVLAPLFALLCSVLGVAWWEFAARRIHGPDEVVSGLAMRVVGAIPELPDPRRRRMDDAQADEIYRHNLIESIDAIRTMLLRTAPGDHLRVIMVTSAVGGEGKTTLASNLAMSLARAGRKTLLIDCDLRRPAAHQLFEQTLQPGFSEVVLHEVDLPDAVRPTTTDPNLYLLPAGHWDREVIQELAKTGIISIFERLREEFDFIIIDSHPVLPATDSLLIGQHVDAVIVSLMRDVSQVHHVHTACQQLATLGIRIFGAVVNGVPIKDYGKGYQYTTQAAA